RPERCRRARCSRDMRRATSLLTVLAVLALAAPATAAAPNYILVSGPGLARPVLLGDWNENLALLAAVANAPRAKAPAVRGRARHGRIELRAGAALELGQRGVRSERRTVRAARGHRVEGVRDREHPRWLRNAETAASDRIALPVPALVVVEDAVERAPAAQDG